MSKRTKRGLVAIILAAGKGTRMNSQIPKVLHRVCGTAMIDHVLDALKPLDPSQVYVVTGHLHEQVKKHVGNRGICVLQRERLGTAHAVKMALPHLKNYDGDVLILYGDAPLIKTESLAALVQRRRSHHNACTVLTTILDDPHGYGRVVRNRDGTVRKIVEEKDTNTYEEKIQEINTGFYCFDAKELFWALGKVTNNNAQREFYLTDTVEILGEANKEVEAQLASDSTEVIGVNSRRDMAMAEKFLRLRILNAIMDQGVTIVDPSTTFIDNTVRIGIDSLIQPYTIIRGNTVIGEGCQIGPNVTVENSRVGNNVRIRNSVVEDANLDSNVSVGPYAYVRPGSLVRENAKVGTFVEIARSDIGRNADILHLTYVGDAHVGAETYIGAGTVTCNFDGSKRQRTEIGEGVYIGANTLLVAPVTVSDASWIRHNSIVNGTVEPRDPNRKPSTREVRSSNERTDVVAPRRGRASKSGNGQSPRAHTARKKKTRTES